MNETELRSIILKTIPELLEELKIPFTVDDMRLSVRFFDDVLEGLKTNFTFQIDFDDDGQGFSIDVYLWREIVEYLVKNGDYIRAVLAHELLHYYEFKTTPEKYFFFPAEIKGSVESYKTFIEFIFDDFRDCVVNALMPPHYLAKYQEYYFLTNVVAMHHVLTRECVTDVIARLETGRVKLKWNVLSVPHFMMCLNTLNGTQMGAQMVANYEEIIKKHDPTGLLVPLHESVKQKFIKIYQRIREEGKIEANLEKAYELSSLIQESLLLPQATVSVDLTLEDEAVVDAGASKQRKRARDAAQYRQFRRELARNKKKKRVR